LSDAFYTRDGDGFAATGLTRGPWDPDAQHAGPPGALLAREMERCEPREKAQVARITLEIMRPVPLARLQVRARVVRSGRSVELLEGELLDDDGSELIRARAWRIRTEQLELPGDLVREPAPPGPEHGEEGEFPVTGSEGYWTAMEYRFLKGGFSESGPALGWLRMRVPLVEGEEPSPLVRVMAAADSGNGVSAILDWNEWLFINTDLSVHLHRMPEGEWVCLDAVTIPEPHGVGMADTKLSDRHGPIGRAVQSLLVGRR
jgi:acyl-Coa thioesterase superfamily protein/acyl-CoA thioesterase superfamily protein